LLHGHVHRTSVDFINNPKPTTMVISAGALYKDLEIKDASTCLHAYNIVRIDLVNKRGLIIFRRYDPTNKRYGIDDTSMNYCDDGKISFSFGEEGFMIDSNEVNT
jgi:hypothetical protein